MCNLSNGAIFNDLERALPPVSRSRHSLTLNISESYDMHWNTNRDLRMRPTQSTNNQTYMHRVPKSNQIKSNLFQATRPIAQTQMTIKHMTKKVSLLMFGNNFGKCGPIYKILSPGDSCENYLCRHHKDFYLTCNVLLHYLVKIENLKTLPNCHVKIDN